MHPCKDEEYGEDGSTVKLRRLIVLDHAGLSAEFGLPTDERDWMQLFAGENKKKTRKKRDGKIDKVILVEAPPAAQTKWQLRMQRLLGDEPEKKEEKR
jgi:hypothetical protein